MKQIIELKLAETRSVFVEAESTETYRELGAQNTRKSLIESFDTVSSTLAAVAENVEQQLSHLKSGPQKVVIEIGAEIRAGGAIFIVSGQASIKLQLTWDRP